MNEHSKLPSGTPGGGTTTPASTMTGIGARLRNYFLTGVVVTAPIGITVYLVWSFVDFVDRTVAPLLPVWLEPGGLMPVSIPGLGLVLALVAVTVIGFLTANLLGRRLVRLSETIVSRMPIVRSVYSALKQIFETMLTQSSSSFRQVVLIEYPRRECWAIAFLANERTGEAGSRLKGDTVAVYLPTAINPTSGYLLFLPRKDVIFLDMSVEEGMKLVLSGGMVIPSHNRAQIAEADESELVRGMPR